MKKETIHALIKVLEGMRYYIRESDPIYRDVHNLKVLLEQELDKKIKYI